MLVVRGPAGIGKSALCRELARVAESQGRTAVLATAVEDGGPYAPITAAVEQVLDTRPEALRAVGERAAAVLARLTPLADSGAVHEHPPTRHEVIGAVRRLLLASAEAVVLAVDDVHLADEATIDLLLQLDSPDRRLVLVLAFRGEEAPDGAGPRPRAVGPGRPDRRSSIWRRSATTRPPTWSRRPRRRCATPRRSTRIVEVAGRQPVPGPGGRPQPGRRRAVADALRARGGARPLGGPGPADIALLERLALAGDGLDPSSLVALAGATEDEVAACIDEALRTGVLVVDGARTASGTTSCARR